MPTVARLGADLNASDHWQYQLDDRGGVAGAVCVLELGWQRNNWLSGAELSERLSETTG